MSPHPVTGRRLWRRPLVGAVAAYLVLVVLLQALGLNPSPPMFAGLFLAVGAVAVYVDGRIADNDPTAWPRLGASALGLGRGADHRTTSLARRLESVGTATPGSRRQLAADIHRQLVPVIVGRLRRSRGRDLTDDAEALALLPPEVAALLADPVDERVLDRLVDPTTLARLLDRIESL
ncbi:MAG: hypothetical protein ABI890_05660 [Lapillicoccus sp.]